MVNPGKLRILLVTDEVWNDTTHPNNVLSNWFGGMSAEFAHISCSPGDPENPWCVHYYQITDAMMLKSIVSGIRAGKCVTHPNPTSTNTQKASWFVSKWPWLRENLKLVCGEVLRAGRELVWYYGRYDEPALGAFIEDFKPDVIFSARMASIKLLRLEQLVRTIAGVPLVAFTGDAEYTNRLISYSPLFWLRRWFLRRAFRGMMPHYSLYFTSSEVQNKEYATEFGDKFSLLRKCATPISEFASHSPQYPIQIVYAGKLYCNRWKTLALLARVLRGVNAGESLVELSVYTRDVVPLHINKQLHDGIGACLRGAVSASELDSIYSRADIALHVEAFDTRNRLATRLSFSTKVVDCLASGCAVMVIAWEEHAGLVYLRKADAAFWATSEVELQQLIQRIVKNPAIIHDYARKAMQCVRSNHDRDSIQQGLVQELARVTGKTQHLEN